MDNCRDKDEVTPLDGSSSGEEALEGEHLPHAYLLFQSAFSFAQQHQRICRTAPARAHLTPRDVQSSLQQAGHVLPGVHILGQ